MWDSRPAAAGAPGDAERTGEVRSRRARRSSSSSCPGPRSARLRGCKCEMPPLQTSRTLRHSRAGRQRHRLPGSPASGEQEVREQEGRCQLDGGGQAHEHAGPAFRSAAIQHPARGEQHQDEDVDLSLEYVDEERIEQQQAQDDGKDPPGPWVGSQLADDHPDAGEQHRKREQVPDEVLPGREASRRGASAGRKREDGRSRGSCPPCPHGRCRCGVGNSRHDGCRPGCPRSNSWPITIPGRSPGKGPSAG